MVKFNWFRKKAKKKEQSVEDVLRGIKGVLGIVSQEDYSFNLYVHRIPKEKQEAYAKRIDTLFGIRGKSQSNNGTEWIAWETGKLSVNLFTKQ